MIGVPIAHLVPLPALVLVIALGVVLTRTQRPSRQRGDRLAVLALDAAGFAYEAIGAVHSVTGGARQRSDCSAHDTGGSRGPR